MASSIENRQCTFCGDREGLYLDATTICIGCAAGSTVSLDMAPSHTAIILTDHRRQRRELLWTKDRSPDLGHWLDRAERMSARLAEIASGQAEIDDPDFVARIDDYYAQTGNVTLLGAVILRQREAKERALADPLNQPSAGAGLPPAMIDRGGAATSVGCGHPVVPRNRPRP